MSHPRVSPLASSQLAGAQALLDRLLVVHKPGFALEREFHTDPGLYQQYNVISYVDWYLRQISGIGA
jgi:hypothetical protein